MISQALHGDPHSLCLLGDFGMAPPLGSEIERGDAVANEWLPALDAARNSEVPALKFDDVYRKCFNDVCHWVRALGGPDAERDDLVQDVFLIVHRRLHTFDGKNLSGWIYQITRHRVRDFRRLLWFRLFLGSTQVDATLVSPSEGPETVLNNKQKEQLLMRLLSRLPESQRSAFVLFEIDGYSGEQIADLQNVSLSTVRARIYRAREKLGTEVKRFREYR
jgi:RNA polymerase sigma-70 factor (ECF subfamily)